MGMESYLLRLRGKQPDSEAFVMYSQRLGIIPDPDEYALSSAYSHYVFRDPLHVIEYELFREDNSYEVSIRFALCHPSSVDQVFLAHALGLMKRFNMTATICEELPEGEPREYNTHDLDRFASNCYWSISRAREYWRAMFGTEEVGLSTRDALGKFFSRSDTIPV